MGPYDHVQLRHFSDTYRPTDPHTICFSSSFSSSSSSPPPSSASSSYSSSFSSSTVLYANCAQESSLFREPEYRFSHVTGLFVRGIGKSHDLFLLRRKRTDKTTHISIPRVRLETMNPVSSDRIQTSISRTDLMTTNSWQENDNARNLSLMRCGLFTSAGHAIDSTQQ